MKNGQRPRRMKSLLALAAVLLVATMMINCGSSNKGFTGTWNAILTLEGDSTPWLTFGVDLSGAGLLCAYNVPYTGPDGPHENSCFKPAAAECHIGKGDQWVNLGMEELGFPIHFVNANATTQDGKLARGTFEYSTDNSGPPPCPPAKGAILLSRQ